MLGEASPDMMGYWGDSQKSTAAKLPLVNGKMDGQLRLKKCFPGHDGRYGKEGGRRQDVRGMIKSTVIHRRSSFFMRDFCMIRRT